jgi:hypothetical protein
MGMCVRDAPEWAHTMTDGTTGCRVLGPLPRLGIQAVQVAVM